MAHLITALDWLGWWLQQPKTVTQENWFWVFESIAMLYLIFHFWRHQD